MTHTRALRRLALAGRLSIFISREAYTEGEKSEQILFWPPFFLPITDSLLCVNYDNYLPDKGGWGAGGYSNGSGSSARRPREAGTGPSCLTSSAATDTLSQDLILSLLRPGPSVTVAVSTLPGLPSQPCPPGDSDLSFLSFSTPETSSPTHSPTLNLDDADQSIPKRPSSDLLSTDKLLGCQPACSLLFCS